MKDTRIKRKLEWETYLKAKNADKYEIVSSNLKEKHSKPA